MLGEARTGARALASPKVENSIPIIWKSADASAACVNGDQILGMESVKSSNLRKTTL
jgi:hypothetical protein